MTPDDFRSARVRIKMTQRQIAHAFGLKERTIQKWEAGTVPIKPIVKLAMERLTQIVDDQR
jgi:DNA-binding transcriptional regulator YiaG